MTSELDRTLNRILEWIREEAASPEIVIEADTNLLAGELLDSMGFIQLISFIEDEFDVCLDSGLLIPANFETPGRIAGLVRRHAAAGNEGGVPS